MREQNSDARACAIAISLSQKRAIVICPAQSALIWPLALQGSDGTASVVSYWSRFIGPGIRHQEKSAFVVCLLDEAELPIGDIILNCRSGEIPFSLTWFDPGVDVLTSGSLSAIADVFVFLLKKGITPTDAERALLFQFSELSSVSKEPYPAEFHASTQNVKYITKDGDLPYLFLFSNGMTSWERYPESLVRGDMDMEGFYAFEVALTDSDESVEASPQLLTLSATGLNRFDCHSATRHA